VRFLCLLLLGACFFLIVNDHRAVVIFLCTATVMMFMTTAYGGLRLAYRLGTQALALGLGTLGLVRMAFIYQFLDSYFIE
jgi:hypothetical protein